MAQAQKGGGPPIGPRRRGARLSIAIPSSLVSEAPHLREKTTIIGQVARAAAIYRVDDIYIYRDAPDESQLMRLILGFIETPQYLRKRLFTKRPELQYVGVLPPLRTPHHPVEKRAEKLSRGEFREGVVVSEDDGACLVDIGVDKPLRAIGRAPSVGSRATVQVVETGPDFMGRFVGRKDIDLYWGYVIHIVEAGIGRLAQNGEFDLTLATSRHAIPYAQIESQIRARWKEAKSILVVFGSPRRGIGELLEREKLEAREVFHFAANMISDQGCETVRTEEAIHATLAVLNLL